MGVKVNLNSGSSNNFYGHLSEDVIVSTNGTVIGSAELNNNLITDATLSDQDINITARASLDYNKTTNKPRINGIELKGNQSNADLGIPTKTSELDNDAGFLSEIPEEYVTESELPKVPTKVSELENDSNYLSGIPEECVTEEELTVALKGKANKADIPTKTSQLHNDAGFLDEVPEEYKTKAENDELYQPKGKYLTSYTETDPTVPDYVKSITRADINRWNTGVDSIKNETDPTVPKHVKNITTDDIEKWNKKSEFSGKYEDLLNKPDLSAIKGMATEKYVNDLFATIPKVPTSLSGFINDVGYLKTFTELDPTVPEHVKMITAAEITKWNDCANAWGGISDYRVLVNKPTLNGVIIAGDKTLKDYGIEYVERETDPIFKSSPAYSITYTDIYNWNKDLIETDPTVPQHVKNITKDDIANWNSKSKDGISEEADPVFKASPAGSITYADITNWNNKSKDGITVETDPTVPSYVKSITQKDIAKWNEVANLGQIEFNNATRRIWRYTPSLYTYPTPNQWSRVCYSVSTAVLPKGKYLILYRCTLGTPNADEGIVTLNGGLDYARLDNTTRDTCPLVPGLLSSSQTLYFTEFTEEKSHVLDLYQYANVYTQPNTVVIDVIRIGDVGSSEGIMDLPLASTTEAGMVRVGDYLRVDEDGTLHVALDGSEGTVVTSNNNSRLKDGQYSVIAINHRGYNVSAPENTIPAFVMSKARGYNYVECDVSFTSDGVPVLLHDATIDRTSNGTGAVKEMTYEELLQYDFGSWKGSEYAGTKIPTFDEFMSLCKSIGLHAYIELKSNDDYTEEQIAQIVRIVNSKGMRGHVTYISFNKLFLHYVKKVDKQARLGYLLSDLTQFDAEEVKELRTGVNEVFIDVEYQGLTDAKINMCIDENIPLEIWTVNDTYVIEHMHSYISGVTSDNLIAGQVLFGENDLIASEEIDPTVPQHVKDITLQDIENWNSGVNAVVNETDPTVPQHVKNITEEDIKKWNTGGDSAVVNKLAEEQNNGTYMWVYTGKDITVPSRTETKLPFDTLNADTSDGKLIHEDSGIRIGPGVKQILVISKWTSWTPGCSKYIYLNKNGERVESASFYNYIWTANIVSYVDVQEGDFIEMACYHDYSGSISISSNETQTALKVIILDETVNLEVTSDPVPVGTVIEYAGDEIPDGYELIEDSAPLSAMTVIMNTNPTYKATTNYARYVMPMTLANSIGNKFTIAEDGGVVIGKGLSKIRINGQMSCNEQNSGYVYGVAIVNQDGTEWGTAYRTLWTASDNRIDNCVVNSRIIDVKEGDVLYMELYIDSNGRSITIRADGTYFTVEEIPETTVYQQLTEVTYTAYSTEEQLVGQWLDGKPLYQRTYKFDIPVGSTSGSVDLSSVGMDLAFIDSSASYVKFKDLSIVQVGFYASATDYSRAFVHGDKTSAVIAMGSVYGEGDKEVALTIKYTKVADKGVNDEA